jgi:plastocyanin
MFKSIRNVLVSLLFVLPAVSQATHLTVTIPGFLFSPDSVNILVGDTVTWTNTHSVPHTSTSNTAIWNSGTLTQGQSFTHIFSAVGHFPYHCAIHTSMTGVVVVSQSTDISSSAGDAVLPSKIDLSSYPNPFNAQTRISFNLPEAGLVSLAVYDIAGRSIRTLVNEYRPAGIAAVTWDGRNNNGEQLASGIYFVRMIAGGQSTTHRAVMLK